MSKAISILPKSVNGAFIARSMGLLAMTTMLANCIGANKAQQQWEMVTRDDSAMEFSDTNNQEELVTGKKPEEIVMDTIESTATSSEDLGNAQELKQEEFVQRYEDAKDNPSQLGAIEEEIIPVASEHAGVSAWSDDIDSFAFGSLSGQIPVNAKFEYNKYGFKLNGRYFIPRGGTVQWFRLPEEVWEDRIKRFKAGGFNTIDLYVPWNVIEPREGEFNFDKPNLKKFIQLCQKHGVYLYFRPGPYITNEMDGGGVPAWLMAKSTKKSLAKDGKPNLRTHDPDFLYYVERYFRKLNAQILPYQITRGGPIIMYSIENEYNWFSIFAIVDKVAFHNGGLERPITQNMDPRPYFGAMRDFLRDQGIELPITTCPGDGKASALNSTPGVIPVPNVYNGLGGDYPEQLVHNLLTDMHNPRNHNGEYVNFPSGTTETDRDPVKIRRLTMGGLDATFAFNIAGSFQEGRQNAMTLDKGDFINFAKGIDSAVTFGLSPVVNYFHNVIDFYGAISPSGLLRPSFYSFKRDNMFFDTVQHYLGQVELPNRSGNFKGADKNLVIKNSAMGAYEPSSLPGPLSQWGAKKVNYWSESADGVHFISLSNDSGKDQRIGINGIRFKGFEFPRYREMLIPSYRLPENEADSYGHLEHNMILVYNYPVPNIGRIAYTTSNLLTLQDFNGGKLLVLYGNKGYAGETKLSQFLENPEVVHIDSTIELKEEADGGKTLVYQHISPQYVVLKVDDTFLRIVILSGDDAGRFWVLKGGNTKVAVIGPDYIDIDTARLNDGDLSFTPDIHPSRAGISLITPFPVNLSAGNSVSSLANYDSTLWLSEYRYTGGLNPPSLPNLLSNGKAKRDWAESKEDFNDSSWTSWNGNPKPLEEMGILRGHAWYRAEIELTKKELDGSWWNPTKHRHLKIDHASDIVSIYINGNYVTTLAPVGTEIDSGHGLNSRYRFPDPYFKSKYLKPGKNSIVFKTEIWGHGSFMWPRGRVLGYQMPALGFDGVKGLFGKARIGNVPYDIKKWKVRAGTTGENAGYQKANYNDSGWNNTALPMTLKKGDVRWYRVKFNKSSLPETASLHAPLAVALNGKNAKATIFLNGRIIGRWISNHDVLDRGFWGRGIRDMWSNTDMDHFPVPHEVLKNGENTFAILVEDTSSHDKNSKGSLDSVKFVYAAENKERNIQVSGNTVTGAFATDPKVRVPMSFAVIP